MSARRSRRSYMVDMKSAGSQPDGIVVVNRGGGGGHAVQRHAAREDDCALAPSQKFGSMMMMLGRVRFEDLVLQEEEEVLGEGTFRTVMRGTYEGEHVAMKKARDF